jgi:heme-degrading monooxygenase HmoA
VYAAVTRTTGSRSDVPDEAVMVGETMVSWLGEIEGFRGLLILNDEAAGTTQVITLWESRDVAERHRESRMRLRDRVTATVDVQVEATVGWEVAYEFIPHETKRTRRAMYAAVTRATGANVEDMAEVAVMVGETMVTWLRDIEGFKGMLMLTDDEGTVQVIALWENEQVAERHREARRTLRERVSATVEVHLEETVGWDVPFSFLPAPL